MRDGRVLPYMLPGARGQRLSKAAGSGFVVASIFRAKTSVIPLEPLVEPSMVLLALGALLLCESEAQGN